MPWSRALVRIAALACSVLLAAAAGARAHDFWIEPSTFRPASGELVALRLRVGERLAGDPVPRSEEMIARFVAVGPDGVEARIVGRDGSEPAGLTSLARPGLHVVGYRSRPSFIELEPAKFDSYLLAEGLERIRDLRVARGEASRPARERYSRCARALLAVGPDAALQADAALGFTLELLAERNPYALEPGEELPLRLTYDGAPLEGALVVALSERRPEATVGARTDADGRVRLRLDAAGAWLAKAVHMVALPPGEDAEWESTWASLTFALGTADAPSAAPGRAAQ
ncbi:MAG: DUF4198 domain-containing protein [Thermodesulfobacteriota bacterium]